MIKKILIAAQSLDGFIAQSREQISTDWTSAADRQFFAKKTSEIGVMLMGSNTYATIGKPLPGRTTILLTPAHTFSGARILDGKPLEHNLYISAGLSDEQIFTLLKQSGVEQIAICGGASVYQHFLKANLIDEIYLTIEPIFLGSGIKLLADGLPFSQTWQIQERLILNKQTTVFHLKR